MKEKFFDLLFNLFSWYLKLTGVLNIQNIIMILIIVFLFGFVLGIILF